MELPRHGQLQNTRFNVGSFMCAAANSGAKDRLEWVIGLPSGTYRVHMRHARPLTDMFYVYRTGVEQLEYRNNSGQVSEVA